MKKSSLVKIHEAAVVIHFLLVILLSWIKEVVACVDEANAPVIRVDHGSFRSSFKGLPKPNLY